MCCQVAEVENRKRQLKVNGYTFRGSNSIIFFVACYMNWGHFINERIWSHRSKFFLLRVDSIWEESVICVSKQKLTKIVSLLKHGGNGGDVQRHLNGLYLLPGGKSTFQKRVIPFLLTGILHFR